ncbi:TetR/AcrR family transcriptional regulator [Mycobacterium sp. CBMA271]|uniref:TetR family transcriptional regulator n=1 Tax=unclassified Mycobacteroides TaxID=2618759 RepID=UPI001328A7DC|nr:MULTISPECIES: TetR family transcriptional regulator [unclassified Mycobacteroides]MUM17793.1 transcriptional regulator [Mycobacteroides sp. CBMA 326]MUM22933.1 TetR/AcrR family transcriptional regulator [Mycobacteroides sp. CBMA 271]
MAQLTFQRARTDEKKRQRAAAIVEAARSLAVESGVTSVTLTAVANRAGVHYSAVRRYFSSHKEVLLHLAAEGWTRWSDTVCSTLSTPGSGSPASVAEALTHGLVDDPLFCDLLANQHLHLEHEVDVERVAEVKQISNAAVIAIAESIERTLPQIGRKGSLDILVAAFSLAAMLWQVSHPPEGLDHDYQNEPGVPPDWSLDFEPAMTRLLTATCIGIVAQAR